MLGILALGPLAIVVVGALIGATLSVGTQYGFHKLVTEPQQEKIKREQEALALKQERKAKVMHLKQFNRALASYNTGALLAKRDLVQAERERAYKDRNYGEPKA